jgi:hypothetical protein
MKTYQNAHRAQDSDMAFWFALFSSLIGLIGAVIFAWILSSLGW